LIRFEIHLKLQGVQIVLKSESIFFFTHTLQAVAGGEILAF